MFHYSQNLLQDRLEGGLLGLLIGDALGVPYEFHAAQDIPPTEQIDFEPPVGFNRTYEGTPAGTWSDDGAQALCLLASLLHCNALDLGDFANRMVNWFRMGYMAVDYRVFDIGITTARALERLDGKIPPELAGENTPNSNGNGSLMRVLPLALWHRGSDAQLIEDAHRQSCVTHRHLRSQICCALYCLLGRRVLQSDSSPWENAVKVLRQHYQGRKEWLDELDEHIQPDAAIAPKGSGYVVDSLHAARYALAFEDYQTAVRWAISLGNDTDTTACIVGGIIGLRDGKSHIPQEWQEKLRGQALYQPLMEQLLHTILKCDDCEEHGSI